MVLEPVAVAAEDDDLGVVDETVDEGGDGDGVAEALGPGGERLVRGDDEAAAFFAGRDECEQECCGVGVDGDVADLIDDEQWDGCKASEFVDSPRLLVRVL